MAVTQNTYTGNGSTVLYSLSFSYLDETDVKVTVNGTLVTNYIFATASSIQFATAPAAGAAIRIYRDTDTDQTKATFFAGSAVRASDLNANFTQTLYSVQEIAFRALNKIGDTMQGILNMGGFKITNLGTPATDTDAANKQYIDERLGEIGIPGHTRWTKTATAGQTVLTGTGDEGNTLEYSASREQVFVNGALLQRNVDYTANDGLIITMLSPLILGDVVDVRCVNNLPEGIDGLASDITFLQAGTGAVSRSVDSKLKDIFNVKDFGAKGDNSTDDTAAIQACINAAEAAYRGVVLFPRGLYRISSSLQLPSFVTLRGETKEGCWITNQGAPLNAPHVVNKDPGALIFAVIEDLSFLFGTYGVKIDVTSEVAGLRLQNVGFFNHTEASFYCNKLLQTSAFYNCNFDSSKYGLRVPASTSNANTFVNCGFLNNTEACVDLYVSECNSFIGCRFEGGGSSGKPTIKVHQAKALKFSGCYFEATNSILLQETGSFNSVSFDSNHFTGAVGGVGGWLPYTFDSDGVVNFGSNRWGEVGSNGSAKMLVTGVNNSIADPTRMLGSKDVTTYLTAARSAYNIVSPVVACPNLTRSLITVDKLVTDGALSNLNMLSGILTTNLYTVEAGGLEAAHVGIYRVTFRSVGVSNIVAHVVTINSTTIGGSVTATIGTTTGSQTTASVSITFANVNPATQISSAFQWSFECLNTGTTRSDIMIPRIS